MDGWIKLHRKVMKSPMYRQLNSKQRDVMMTILLLANHESNTWEFRGDVYDVQPGQFITSLDSLKEHCASDVTTQNIRTALLKLEKHGFLTNESTKKNRLITVVNWGIYQGYDDSSNKEINRQPTNSQQTANNQLTTNKNDKNLKNEKKDKKKEIIIKISFSDSVSMTQVEYDKLVSEFGEGLTKKAIGYLTSYKAEKGYKTKSDYLTIRRWVIDAVSKQKGGSSFGQHQGSNERNTQSGGTTERAKDRFRGTVEREVVEAINNFE